MTSTGTKESTPPVRRRTALMAGGAALAALLLASFVGVQVFGVLYGIVFPPDVPLPPDVLLLRHTETAYGVDSWDYETRLDHCAVIAHYRAEGGTCSTAPGSCGGQAFSDPLTSTQTVGTCRDTVEFSIFEMMWEITVYASRAPERPTRFQVQREIFWIGDAPDLP